MSTRREASKQRSCITPGTSLDSSERKTVRELHASVDATFVHMSLPKVIALTQTLETSRINMYLLTEMAAFRRIWGTNGSNGLVLVDNK